MALRSRYVFARRFLADSRALLFVFYEAFMVKVASHWPTIWTAAGNDLDSDDGSKCGLRYVGHFDSKTVVRLGMRHHSWTFSALYHYMGLRHPYLVDALEEGTRRVMAGQSSFESTLRMPLP